MDQRELHELEARCIHDAPPPCTADCPLGVDARGVLEAVVEGEFDDGLRLLAARVLVPELLSRVCEEPCRAACPREGSGGSLRVRAVEAACVAEGREAPQRRVPLRAGVAVVVGGGLAGMTTALDLALRGYQVRLLEAAGGLGGRLRHDSRVPAEALQRAAGRLEAAGVTVELEHVVDAAELCRLVMRADAVCLGCVGFATPPAGVIEAHAGRDDAAVAAVAAARRAAAAADLMLRGIPPRPPSPPARSALPAGFGKAAAAAPAIVSSTPASGYTLHEAIAEAARCLRCACRECLDACLFLQRSTRSPKALLREINNNLVVTPGMGYRASKSIITACRLCGLCAEVCPADIDFGDVCREARRGLCERDAMPPAVHEALLHDVAASNGPAFALARPQPGAGSSRFAWFPGCQLPASRPEAVQATYEHLIPALAGGVGLLLGCCGAPAVWAGRDDLASAALDAVERGWSSLGEPTLIVACPSCAATLSTQRPHLPQVSLWEVLADHPPAASDRPRDGELPALAVHDPCALRHDEGARFAIRRILDAAGCNHRDLPRSGRLTECCGFGGLQHVAAPGLAAETLARQVSADERTFVTSCAMCRDQFAAAGKPTLHVLDILFGCAEEASVTSQAAAGAGLAGPGPSWTERRAARERCARSLRRDLWGEQAGGDGSRSPAVTIPVDVRSRLSEAFILETDVAAVVESAEVDGPRFADQATGRLFAAGRPGSVTYWVAYTRERCGPVVRHVYSHRMQILQEVIAAPTSAEIPSAGTAAGVTCEACGLALACRPVRLSYLGVNFDVELPSCPSCGAVYISDEVADGRMREVELSLEDK